MQAGTIELITGPMCASKTQKLLQMYEKERGEKVLLSYHDSHGKGGVWSRAGLFSEALITTSLPQNLDAASIFVDEGQFYGNLVDFCLSVTQKGSHVVVAALDCDYLRRPWPSVERLIPHCSFVQHLTARCECGSPALWSARVGGSVELIDREATYIPTCTPCWEKHQCIFPDFFSSEDASRAMQ